MAKKKWIKKAVEGGEGKFRAKAEKAGMDTKEYAEKEKDAPGKTGKQARLALTLMNMRSKMYGGK